MTSTRFAVATHILAVLEYHTPEPVSSDSLAFSVNTSASVVRQILMRLKDAGLVDSVLGKGGGTFLAKPASDISLADVFRATEEEHIISTHRKEPQQQCVVGRHILGTFCEVANRAEHAMIDVLSETSIADVSRDIARRESTSSA